MTNTEGKIFVSLPTAALFSIIMFLGGGYWGDWNASSKNLSHIERNTSKIEDIMQRTAVMENRIENIESIAIEIKSDVKKMNNDRH